MFCPHTGTYPVSKLTVIDNRLPVDVSVYAYSRYKHNDMNRSATPAVAFTAVIKNPLSTNVTTSFMFNLPLGIEPRTQRSATQMPQNVSAGYPSNEWSAEGLSSLTQVDCFTACSSNSSCMSWSYNSVSKMCNMFSDVRLNGHDDNSFAGVKVGAVVVCSTYFNVIVIQCTRTLHIQCTFFASVYRGYFERDGKCIASEIHPNQGSGLWRKSHSFPCKNHCIILYTYFLHEICTILRLCCTFCWFLSYHIYIHWG